MQGDARKGKQTTAEVNTGNTATNYHQGAKLSRRWAQLLLNVRKTQNHNKRKITETYKNGEDAKQKRHRHKQNYQKGKQKMNSIRKNHKEMQQDDMYMVINPKEVRMELQRNVK